MFAIVTPSGGYGNSSLNDARGVLDLLQVVAMEPMFQQLGISLLLGLLVGLQREHAAAGTAGMRTFPLISVLGTVSALLAAQYGGWIVAAGLLGIVALMRRPGHSASRGPEANRGTTTDVAMLLMFAVGALLAMGPRK